LAALGLAALGLAALGLAALGLAALGLAALGLAALTGMQLPRLLVATGEIHKNQAKIGSATKSLGTTPKS
jgi:hypothetical protein